MGDARCNGSAAANYSAVMSDTVRGDVHELTLRLSPGSPARSRRHACDCTTVVPPFGRREGAPTTTGKVTKRQHPREVRAHGVAGSAPPAPAVLPVDISGALGRACPKRVTRMIRRTDRGFTPVYDSVRAAAVEGIPFATGYPPRHPDIYRQLCTEIGHDPRCSAYTDIAGDTRAPAWTPGAARDQRRGHQRAGAHALPWWQSQLSFT
jgi:hypothetical protein